MLHATYYWLLTPHYSLLTAHYRGGSESGLKLDDDDTYVQLVMEILAGLFRRADFFPDTTKGHALLRSMIAFDSSRKSKFSEATSALDQMNKRFDEALFLPSDEQLGTTLVVY